MRDRLIQTIRETYARFRTHIVTDLPEEQGCLYLAVITAAVLREQLVAETKVVAGSMSWPRVNPDQDDGVSPTHFTYKFNDPIHELGLELEDPLLATLCGRMPEMHVWTLLRISSKLQLVDPSTRYIKAQCARLGVPWLGDDPPDYLWCDATQLPPRVFYVPDGAAIKCVQIMVAQHWPGYRV